jgi:acyl-CoA reductase-like NAD-dependent aldehyde dehydrogenase
MNHLSGQTLVDPAATAAAIVGDFLSTGPKKLLIGGQWVDAQSGQTFEVVDPTTEQVLASVALAEKADVDAAVAAATRAFDDPSWSCITPHARARYLLDIADLMEEHVEELAALQSFEMGAPLALTRMMAAAMADTFRYYAGWTTKMFGRTNPSDTSVFNYTLREPLGVVGAIIPWNGPILAATWKIAPALACANTIVMKPAEVAPLAVIRLAELIVEAGVPAGVVNMVPGFGAGAGEALINHPDVAKLAFTGSTAIGKHLMEVASKTMKKVSLELGGKGPTIIFNDADLDRAAQLSAVGFVANTGQACVAGSRILVQDGVYDAFATKLVAAVEAMKGGSPFDEQSFFGPLSSKPQFDRVAGYFDLAVAEGARAHRGQGGAGDRLLRPANNLRRRATRHAGGARGDLWPGRSADALRRRGRGRVAGQRHGVWPLGGRVDARRGSCHAGVQGGQGRHRLGEHDVQPRSGFALRRLQVIGLGPRTRAGLD